MVIPCVHGDVGGEVEEAVIANPGELQVGVEDNRHEMDRRKMTRSINSYHSPGGCKHQFHVSVEPMANKPLQLLRNLGMVTLVMGLCLTSNLAVVITLRHLIALVFFRFWGETQKRTIRGWHPRDLSRFLEQIFRGTFLILASTATLGYIHYIFFTVEDQRQ